MTGNSVEQEGEVQTKSRLRAWWLSTFKGYRIKLIVNGSPKQTVFGGVKYDSLWILIPQRNGYGSAGK